MPPRSAEAGEREREEGLHRVYAERSGRTGRGRAPRSPQTALAAGRFRELLAEQDIAPREAKRQILALPLVQIVIDGAKRGAWQRTRSELAELAEPMHGRVFHRTNHDPAHWVSFEAAAKQHAVSHYQFHAPRNGSPSSTRIIMPAR